MSSHPTRRSKPAERRLATVVRWPRLLLVGATVAMLYFGQSFLVPLVMASLLTFILSPLVDFAQRRGLGRVPAVLLVVLVTIVVGAAITYVLANELVSLAVDLPAHRDEIEAKLSGLRGIGADGLSRLSDMVNDLGGGPAPGTTTVVVAHGGSQFEGILGMIERLAGWGAAAFVVLLLAIFTLIRREDVRNRALGLLGYGRLTGATRATVEGARRLSRLLLLQLAVNLGFGVLFGLGLAIIGVPYWFLWGFVAAVMRFIPYVGVLVAAAGPALLTVATSPGWTMAAAVFSLVIVLELVVANVVEPLLFSKHTGVSTLALLVAALFWTWLWGPMGLVLSTPLTLCLVVLGQHAPRFQFLAMLLDDRPALAAHASFYQRLIASDEREAVAVATVYAAEHGPGRTFDDVLLPALRRIRLDRDDNGVDAKGEAYVLDATARALLTFRGRALASPPSTGLARLVLACPAHHRSEEIALTMMAKLCAPEIARVEVISSRALAAEVEAQIARDRPALVVIGVVPPGGLTQAAFLCRRLRRAFPGLTLVVAYLRQPKDFDGLLVRLKKAGASYVTTSLAQTANRIDALLGSPPAAAA